MKDFLGTEIKLGDFCVFLHNNRTGSSTIRKAMSAGEVVGFTQKKVKFQDFTVFPEDTVVSSHLGVWIDGMDTTCSNCGFTCSDTFYLGSMVACPNCGAKMIKTIAANASDVQDIIDMFKQGLTENDWIELGYSKELTAKLKELLDILGAKNNGRRI